MTTISQALRIAQSQGLDRLDAQLLLLHALGKPVHDRAWLLAHDTDKVPAMAQVTLDTCVLRRVRGEPLAYITGNKEFFGLNLAVDSRVLIPRPDTEGLVEWTLEVLLEVPNAQVIDLGTGSGAIALALKATRSDLQVLATDASTDALVVARGNAHRLQLDVRFQQGSWFETVSDQFHAIVSNPPYIAAQDKHLNELTHEPLQSLVCGSNGLDDLHHIINHARSYLHPGGWLLLEHGYDQASTVRELLTGAGFKGVQSRRDLSGIERCSGGQASVGSSASAAKAV
ncbi:MAG: peptide chain release factor N(5)-glutamine methyltransferase [Comamonadaceae bacterium]